jgi:large subunit ribosomal protein L29|tara:strand:+ start:21314 stop:21523 length:210 start_codon:yes stop_codon:yes gene_type:complete
MKTNEIRDMDDVKLENELLKLRKEQFDLRVHSASGQGVKPNLFGQIRKDIARIKTIQSERKNLLEDNKD